MSHNHTYSYTRIRWFWTISLLSFLAFIGVALLVISEKVSRLDTYFTEIVRRFEQPWLTVVAKGVTNMGSNVSIIVICIVVFTFMYFVLQTRREAMFFIAVILSSAILNVLLKNMFQRLRPDINLLIEVTGYSFPSGHSMSAFTLYGILTFLLWAYLDTGAQRNIVLIVFVVIILSIGISRIYLGVHYPSDVIGGYLASCSWLMLVLGVYESRQKHSV